MSPEGGNDTSFSRRTVLKATSSAVVGGAAVTAASTSGAASGAPVDERPDTGNSRGRWVSMDEVNWIVLHWTVTATYDRTASAITSGGSYHYVVDNYDNPGYTGRFVHPQQTAYHALSNAMGHRHHLADRSIGISYVWDYNQRQQSNPYVLRDETLSAMGDLISYLCEEYDIPKQMYAGPYEAFGRDGTPNVDGGIIGHVNVPDQWDSNEQGYRSFTHCPGFRWVENRYGGANQGSCQLDPDELMSYVRDGGDGGETFEDGQPIRSASTVNTRERPGIDDDVLEQFEAGEPGKIVNGPIEEDGYTWWGVHWTDAGVWGWSAESLLEACPGFCHGTRVEAAVDSNVRPEPGSADIIHTVPAGQTGRVVSGPQQAWDYNWWEVEWDSGVTGWSPVGDDWLVVQ